MTDTNKRKDRNVKTASSIYTRAKYANFAKHFDAPVDAVVALGADVTLERPGVVHERAVATRCRSRRTLLTVEAGRADVTGRAVSGCARVRIQCTVVPL